MRLICVQHEHRRRAYALELFRNASISPLTIITSPCADRKVGHCQAGALCVRGMLLSPKYVILHPSVHDALYRNCDTHALCTSFIDRSQHGLTTNGAILVPQQLTTVRCHQKTSANSHTTNQHADTLISDTDHLVLISIDEHTVIRLECSNLLFEHSKTARRGSTCVCPHHRSAP